MRTIRSAIVALPLLASSLHAEEKDAITQAFPALKQQLIEDGEAASAQKIAYDPGLSKLINEPAFKDAPKDDPSSEIRRLISTKINRETNSTFLIDFDPGPSADPSFVITDEKTRKPLGSIAADSLAIPGNGFIYAIGRSNNLHTERQKFTIQNGKLEEVKQPFSYVGLETKAKAALTLTSGKSSGPTIASIPKDDPLQVVIRDGEYLLIKTQFGLVGWWKMKTDVQADNAEIEGIYYAGD